jgi:hypothetical protein
MAHSEGATVEREYRLLEAAQFLGIDYKTLRRLLDRAKIAPKRDEIDRRRQLLTQRQVDQLSRLMRRGGERSIEALNERLIALEENNRILQEELDALMKRLNLTLDDLGKQTPRDASGGLQG